MKNDLVIALVSVVLCEAVCWGIKLFYRKDRPVPYERDKIFLKFDANSFPSTHTAVAAVLVTIFTPNVLGLVILCAVAYSRVYFKKHYVIDVLAGAAIGILVTFFVSYVRPS